MRLNRYIAQCGVCSRRHADELIQQGQVTVNGFPARELGTVIDPEADQVAVQGRRVKPPAGRVYILLYKPRGVVTTLDDPQGRPTVAGLIDLPRRVVPVGRLDQDSSGVLLLTDDGDLCHRLLHPSSRLAKEYLVLLDRPLSAGELERFRTGIVLEGETTLPAEIEAVGRSLKHARYRIVLREGRNRQIRRMVEALGAHVERLSRKSFAGLGHTGMEPGEWRFLGRKEVDQLRRAVKESGGHELPERPVVRPAGEDRPTAPRRHTPAADPGVSRRRPAASGSASPARSGAAAKPAGRPAAGRSGSAGTASGSQAREGKPAGRAQARVTTAPAKALPKTAPKTSPKANPKSAPKATPKASSHPSSKASSKASSAKPPKSLRTTQDPANSGPGKSARQTNRAAGRADSASQARTRRPDPAGAPTRTTRENRPVAPERTASPVRGTRPDTPPGASGAPGASIQGRTSPWAKTRLANESRSARETPGAGRAPSGTGSAGTGAGRSAGAKAKPGAANSRPSRPGAENRGRAQSRAASGGEPGRKRGDSGGIRKTAGAPAGAPTRSGWASKFIPAPKNATPKGSVRGPGTGRADKPAGASPGSTHPKGGKPAGGPGKGGASPARGGGGAKGRDTGKPARGKPGRG